MLLSINELAHHGNKMGTIRIPFGGGEEDFGFLEDSEIETLGMFEGLTIEVSPEALPLQLYLGNGGSWSLAIYPHKGGTIKLGQKKLRVQAGDRKLLIVRDPFPER